MRWLLLTIWLMMPAGAIRADTIHLRNGYQFDGIITEESDTQVVLELGTGRTTIPRRMIASIDRASEDVNDYIQAGSRQKYFLHRKNIPAELTGLATEFEKLGALRDGALHSRQTMDESSAKELRLKAELEQLRGQIVQVSQRIQETPEIRKNVGVYNALVTESNALQARRAMANDELAACRKEYDAAADGISAYQAAVSAFGLRFAAEQKKPANGAADAARKQFFDRLAPTVAEYAREFSSVTVPVTRLREGVVVAATVNEQVQGRFLVDTGAGRVTVSEAFARRLQLDLERLPVAEFTMADGNKSRGHVAVFHVLAVGDARVEDVEAAVLPGPPGEEFDGLLGMSFLKHFAVSLDGNSGKLILRQFAPGQAR